MSNIYKKLYGNTLTFPVIPSTGITESDVNNGKYYILLEKNYVPITSTESHSSISGTDINITSITLTPEDTYYNRLCVVVGENTTSLKKLATIEFWVPENQLTGAISPCNHLFVNFILAPKEDIYAYIQIDEISNLQNNLESDKEKNKATYELSNGDNRILTITYYGIKRSSYTKNGTEKTLDSKYITNVELKILSGGMLVDIPEENKLSETTSGNGITVKYSLSNYDSIATLPNPVNETTPVDISENTIKFFAKFNTDYKVVYSECEVIQPGNGYILQLGINNLTTLTQTADAIQNTYDLYARCMKTYKNGEHYYLKSYDSFKINWDYVDFYPIVNQLLSGFSYDESNCYYIMRGVLIKNNFTNLLRKVLGYISFESKTSNYITITLNNTEISIVHSEESNTLTKSENIYSGIPGAGGTYTIKYYATAASTYQIISMENTINGVTTTDTLTATSSTVTIFNEQTVNDDTAPYKTFTITIPPNKDDNGNTQTYTITLKLNDSITQDITLTLQALELLTDIINDGSVTSTTEIGGLKDYNTVVLYYKGVNLDGDVLDADKVTIEFTENEDLLNTPTVTISETYIMATYTLKDDYDLDANNTTAQNRTIKYKVKYNNTLSNEHTITLYPIYFGSYISVDKTDYISNDITTGTLTAYGILYNRYNDWTHKTNVSISVNDLSVSNSLITLSNKKLSTNNTTATVSAGKNNTGSDLTITITSSYKGLNTETVSNDPTGYTNVPSCTVTVNLGTLSPYLTCSDGTNTITSPFTMNPFNDSITFTFTGGVKDADSNDVALTEGGSITVEVSDNTHLENTIGTSTLTSGTYLNTITIPKNLYESEITITAKYNLTVGSTALTELTFTITKPKVLTVNPDGTYNDGTVFNVLSCNEVTAAGGTSKVKCLVIYHDATNTYSDYTDINSGHYSITSTDLSIDTAQAYNETDNAVEVIFTVPKITGSGTSYAVSETYEYKSGTYFDRKIQNTDHADVYVNQQDSVYSLKGGFDTEFKIKEVSKDGLTYNIPVYILFYCDEWILNDDTQNPDIEWSGLADSITIINKNTYVTSGEYNLYELQLPVNTDIYENKKYEFTGTWHSKTITLTVNRTPITNISVVLEMPSTADKKGETIDIIYYVKSGDTIFDPCDKLATITRKFKNTSGVESTVTISFSKGTDFKYTGLYTFSENTVQDTNPTLTIEAEYDTVDGTRYKSGEKTCTLAAPGIELHIEANDYSLSCDGDDVTITYWAVLNDENVTSGISSVVSTNTAYTKKSETTTSEVDGKYKFSETWTIGENLTTSTVDTTFSVTYQSKTATTSTVSQAGNSFSATLDLIDHTDKIIDKLGNDTVKFKYKGLKNISTIITDTSKVTLIHKNPEETGTVTIENVTVNGNQIECTITFSRNESGAQKQFIFYTKYEYSSGNYVYSTEITLNLDIGQIDVYITASPEVISLNGGTLIISYYGLAGTTYITSGLEIAISDVGDESDLFKYTIVTNSRVVDNHLLIDYTVDANSGLHLDVKKLKKWTATYTATGAYASVIVTLSGSGIYLPAFDIFGLKYQWLGGKDLDTATLLTISDNRSLPIYTSSGAEYDLTTLAVGFSLPVASKDSAGTSRSDLLKAMNAYINYSGDNTSVDGYESVSVDFRLMILDFNLADSNTDIIFNIWGSWYSARWDGNVKIYFDTYKNTEFYKNIQGYTTFSNYVYLVKDESSLYEISDTCNLYGRGTAYDGTNFVPTYASTYGKMATLTYHTATKDAELVVLSEAIAGTDKEYYQAHIKLIYNTSSSSNNIIYSKSPITLTLYVNNITRISRSVYTIAEDYIIFTNIYTKETADAEVNELDLSLLTYIKTESDNILLYKESGSTDSEKYSEFFIPLTDCTPTYIAAEHKLVFPSIDLNNYTIPEGYESIKDIYISIYFKCESVNFYIHQDWYRT